MMKLVDPDQELTSRRLDLPKQAGHLPYELRPPPLATVDQQCCPAPTVPNTKDTSSSHTTTKAIFNPQPQCVQRQVCCWGTSTSTRTSSRPTHTPPFLPCPPSPCMLSLHPAPPPF